MAGIEQLSAMLSPRAAGEDIEKAWATRTTVDVDILKSLEDFRNFLGGQTLWPHNFSKALPNEAPGHYLLRRSATE